MISSLKSSKGVEISCFRTEFMIFSLKNSSSIHCLKKKKRRTILWSKLCMSVYIFLLWSFYETPFCTTIEVFFTLEWPLKRNVRFWFISTDWWSVFLIDFCLNFWVWQNVEFFFQVIFFFVKIAVKRKNALGRTARICIWFFNNFGIYTCINHLKKK